MQWTARRVEQIRDETVRPAVRAAGQGPRRLGAQRRYDGAVGARTPESDPAAVAVHGGEKDRPRLLGEQQPPIGGEQAKAGPGR
ncbi:hypothetical protein ACGFRB_04565 [Streptomyces sp. NPDC048718]|uniref:hypothetical protein n=1 Tax=Streptomyces sp. NPDC048718 TaxID=3365587 RepID=UPI0037161E0A